jgi:type II secretory pathway pseudopilin PulG
MNVSLIYILQRWRYILVKQSKKTGRPLNNAKGFSLMELVIIIAILAILSVLLVPRIISITKESKEIEILLMRGLLQVM